MLAKSKSPNILWQNAAKGCHSPSIPILPGVAPQRSPISGAGPSPRGRDRNGGRLKLGREGPWLKAKGNIEANRCVLSGGTPKLVGCEVESPHSKGMLYMGIDAHSPFYGYIPH